MQRHAVLAVAVTVVVAAVIEKQSISYVYATTAIRPSGVCTKCKARCVACCVDIECVEMYTSSHQHNNEMNSKQQHCYLEMVGKLWDIIKKNSGSPELLESQREHP